MPSTFVEFSNDCEILLDRAFKNKPISCFGFDGNGQYGTHPFPKYFKIYSIDSYVTGKDINDGVCTALLYLEGYNAADCGHVATDQNLKIALNKLLIDQYIDPSSWDWANENLQGQNFVSVNFSLKQLLG